jgi:hypothetical protein
LAGVDDDVAEKLAARRARPDCAGDFRPQLRCRVPSQIEQPVAIVTNPAMPRIPKDKMVFMVSLIGLPKSANVLGSTAIEVI